MASSRLRAVEDNPERPSELTIEQLAQATGMTVRNIRNHQSRGLLPPPEVRARTGYYGPEHVRRLDLIREMQAEGFNLAAIQRLLEGGGGAGDRLLDYRRAIAAPWQTETPEILTPEELAERFGPTDERALRKARELDLLVPMGDGRFEAPSPALLRAAEEVLALGISLDAALQVVERVRRNCESVSRGFVKLFLAELWEPYVEEGQPPERFDDVVAAVERLRPIASEALMAVFRQTMTAEVEDAFGRVLEREAKRK